MIRLSFTLPGQVQAIYQGRLMAITRITSMREPTIGDKIELYYKPNTPNQVKNFEKKEVACTSCLRSKIITDRKCSYYDKDTYSIDVRCPQFVNFIGYGNVVSVEQYESFEGILDKEFWAVNNGFLTLEEGKEYYENIMGKGWGELRLTVIEWNYL